MIRIGTFFAAVVLLFSACSQPSSFEGGENGGLSVAASFAPLAFFASEIGGEFVEVQNLTPMGAEPHDFEPSPRDIAVATEADIFLFQSAGITPWAEKIAPQVLGRSVSVSDLISLHEHEEDEHDDEDHEEEGEDHDHGGIDPHFWLDPVLAAEFVSKLEKEFEVVDPVHAGVFQKNAEDLISRLEALDSEFLAALENCGMRTIVVAHDAFGYLAERYGIDAVAIAGLSPEAVPSPRKLAELSDLIAERGLDFVFFEESASPEFSETLARETGAGTLVFSPAEVSTDGGYDYFAIMEKNLQNLRTALKCQ